MVWISTGKTRLMNLYRRNLVGRAGGKLKTYNGFSGKYNTPRNNN
jgi:hypothetical protein